LEGNNIPIAENQSDSAKVLEWLGYPEFGRPIHAE